MGKKLWRFLPIFVAIILFQILKVSKKEFIINLDTVYNKPLRYLLKTWIEFIRFRGFCVKKKEWLQWITGIFFSYLVNNRYNRLNDCIDYIILQYIIVLLDNRSFNVQSSCRLFNQIEIGRASCRERV